MHVERIKNPLRGLSKEQLFQNVHNFANEHGLTHAFSYLKKGALVAQRPQDFENIPELDEHDREALRDEVVHRWRLPWPLYYTIVLNSIAAAIQGWDQTGIYSVSLTVLFKNDPNSGKGFRVEWRQSFFPNRVWNPRFISTL